jgi:drug/metabolite transporter (DMT)-like permease
MSARAPTTGMVLMLFAVAVFSIMDALVKLATVELSPAQVTFCRAVFGLIPVLAVLPRYGGWTALKTQRPWAHALRATLNLTSMLLFFTGIRDLPLASAIAIAFSAPLFMTILSIPLLGERVGIHRWGAVVVGFGGVLLMTNPGGAVIGQAELMVLASAFTYALNLVLVRRLGVHETAVALAFWAGLGGALVMATVMPALWVAPAGASTWGLLVVIGLLGGCGQLLMITAFQRAEASLLAPLDYTALAWAAALGIVMFGEWPSLNVWLGAAIVVACGLYILHRERIRQPR